MTYQNIILNKIKTLVELKKIRASFIPTAEVVVFTNGCFDLLHTGHIHTLSAAKALGTKLIVGINADSSIKRLKGTQRPIQNQNERMLIVAALSFVDYVVLFEEDTPINLIENLKPNHLVKGGDYAIASIVGADFVLKNGGQVHCIPFLEGFSTTQTIQKMNNLA